MTERKQAEQALRESRERLAFAVRAADGGSWDWDVRSGEISWSAGLFEIFGIDPLAQTASFEAWRSVLHPEDAAKAERLIEEALRDHTELDSEYRIVRYGEVRWISARGDVTYDEHSRPLRMIGLCFDITERKRAEAELRALYEEQRDVATILQGNLVHPLPEIDGLEAAALSLPAMRPELVGGDFHDVFRVADDRVVVLIGDVMGKGIMAAGLTETVRSAARALALVTGSPAKMLRHLNRLLLAEEHEQFVSALLLVLNPKTGRGVLASAGHLPPVVAGRGGAALLEPPYGPLLGLFEAKYQERKVNLAPEETLVFYTDGLVEARRERELFGEARLLSALDAAGDLHPEDLVAHLRETVLAFAGTLQDDLEIVALRRRTRRSRERRRAAAQDA